MEAYRAQLLEALGVSELPEVVECALSIAVRAHAGVKRKSGEDFIEHPVAVACIAAPIVRGDPTTIAAALMHDVVEDSDVPPEEIAQKCGQDVLDIVLGVTKVSQLNFPSREAAQIDTYRKMILAMVQDIRVIIVKLCDRIHNMRTIASMKPEAQLRIARETMDIYAPIAHRLGIHRFKAELEDRSFAILQPEQYAQVASLVETAERDRLDRLDAVGLELQLFLAEQDIEAQVTGRVKHLYSVHRKMVKKGQDFDQITDIVALRVLVERIRDCYMALGLVHNHWLPIPGRFKDYIAMPKLNGYQSLHTTVYTGEEREKPLEIQIRTYEMHRDAEYGIAAHFEYKEGSSPTARTARLARSQRDDFLSGLHAGADGQTSPEAFFTHLKEHLAPEEEVYIYTPLGDVKVLPKGATPIDFAYSVHTDVGNKCVGARVNGKAVSFAYQLRSGDHVEIMTREGSTPSRDWLQLAVTPRALGKIRAFHAQSDRAEQESAGRRELIAAVRKSRLSLDTITGPELVGIVDTMGFRSASDFYIAIGSGRLAASTVIKHLKRKAQPAIRLPRFRNRTSRASVVDEQGLELTAAWQLAKCCNPIPGDPIIGLVEAGKGLLVHRQQCPQLEDRVDDPQRLMILSWQLGEATAQTQIVVQGDNRPGLLEDIASQVAAHGGNIMSHSGTTANGAFSLLLSVQLSDLASLERMLAAIRSISGVFDTFRAGSH
jgi:GTP pyrophosphokinase